MALCFGCNWRARADGLQEALDLLVSHVEAGCAADDALVVPTARLSYHEAAAN